VTVDLFHLLKWEAWLIEWLQGNDGFTSATSFRDQCFHACRILGEGHTQRVPLELIGQVFTVRRGTFYNHGREYKARGNEAKHARRSPALYSQELDEIFTGIFHGFQQRSPLTLWEIALIMQNKF
jgi:hypothetical protein